MKKSLENHDPLHSLRLIRSEGVGPMTFVRLLNKFGDAAKALQAMPNFPKPMQPANLDLVQKEYQSLLKMGGAWLDKTQAAYPPLMAPLDEAPPVLSTLGNTELLQKPMLAIVGSRNASLSGRKLAAQLANDLSRAGYVIVSGLARGIDTAAHEAALETGTVAVLANGVDIVYPPENQKLYDAIRQKGLLLSENALGTEPTAQLFPRRNRIISGLSIGTIVIEAAAKSGSLITARCALEQGREVFAVPGSPLDARCRGPNQLIKRNEAHLIESADDILEILGAQPSITSQRELFAADDAEELPQGNLHTPDQARHAILSCISATPCSIDEIAANTNVPVAQILTLLVEFELLGQIQRLAGNKVAHI